MWHIIIKKASIAYGYKSKQPHECAYSYSAKKAGLKGTLLFGNGGQYGIHTPIATQCPKNVQKAEQYKNYCIYKY
jgi:hypothetical protein